MKNVYEFRGMGIIEPSEENENGYKLLTLEIGDSEFPIARERLYNLIFDKYQDELPLALSERSFKLSFSGMYYLDRNDDLLTQRDLSNCLVSFLFLQPIDLKEMNESESKRAIGYLSKKLQKDKNHQEDEFLKIEENTTEKKELKLGDSNENTNLFSAGSEDDTQNDFRNSNKDTQTFFKDPSKIKVNSQVNTETKDDELDDFSLVDVDNNKKNDESSNCLIM